MANARTRFDTICDYMVRSHGATSGALYGKPCVLVRGHAFLYFHQGWAAFKLRGRVRLQALALAGAKFWDPLGRDGPSMEWVIVPDAHFLRWDRFAVEAVKLVEKDAGGRRPEAAPAQGPPPLPPASLRWLDSIKTLWSRAANLTLARQDPLPEKSYSRLFDDDSSPPEPAEARAFTGLAESADASSESAIGETAARSAPTGPVPTAPVPTAPVPTGRASFAVAAEPGPPTPLVTGRASFGIGVDPLPAATTPAPTEPPEMPVSPLPSAAGRASFDVGVDPLPASMPTPSTRPEPITPPLALPEAALVGGNEAGLAAWQERIAKYEIEAERAETPISGRAVFEARDVTPPATVEPGFRIKQSEQPLGRASFLLPDDVAPVATEEPAGLEYPPKPPNSDAD